MTIKELYNQLNHYVETQPEIADWEVKVILDHPSIGGLPSVGIRYAYPGFDWDRGKFLMTPTTPLTFKMDVKKNK